eukprot:CAMPEP_0176194350 /NCGR_PEP_ID=MMETSP0121_2-20121125/5955_1 /TAXON_ID=160619 /ORGANISM="Kryptoperidinium foliaceum, Strain CCMP 1326" /LENGTH=534 /DNA_ID=CAMNT_0017533093 /DNA_START=15 /DNA_END=1617 /DNA_ORIENTATION=+
MVAQYGATGFGAVQAATKPNKPVVPSGTTLAQTASNMINCFVGGGILTVPFAFRHAGFAASFVLMLVAALNWLTSILLGHALSRAARLRPDISRTQWDLAELGAAIFGPMGRRIIAVVLTLELWFMLETYIILTSININLLTGAPMKTLIAMAGIVGTLTLSLPMSVVAGFSKLSVWCMLGGVVSLVVCGGMASQAPNLHERRHHMIDVKALPAAAGIFSYCFAGLPCLPNIRSAMQKQGDYALAVNLAFAFAITYYLVVGLLGYHYFGDATKESFTENLVPYKGMPDERMFLAFSLASSALFAVKLQAGFPLYAAPVLQALGFGTLGEESRLPTRVVAARMTFALASVAFALFARNALSGVAELMGAFLTMTTSVLFPVAAYAGARRASGEPLGWCEALGLGAVFLVGVLLAASDAYRRMTATTESPLAPPPDSAAPANCRTPAAPAPAEQGGRVRTRRRRATTSRATPSRATRRARSDASAVKAPRLGAVVSGPPEGAGRVAARVAGRRDGAAPARQTCDYTEADVARVSDG